MVTTITIEIYDAAEMDVIRQGMVFIEQYREQKQQLLAWRGQQQTQQAQYVDNVPPAPAVETIAPLALAPDPEPAGAEADPIALVRELNNLKGLAAARALLDQFKVTRVSELEASQKPAFVQAALEAIRA